MRVPHMINNLYFDSMGGMNAGVAYTELYQFFCALTLYRFPAFSVLPRAKQIQ